MRDYTFEAGFRIIYRELMTDVNTCFPATVTAFDGKNKVEVQPAIMMRPKGGQDTPLPTISDVPVVFPGGGGYRITHPISVGDTVLIVCAQRAIDRWKVQGGLQPAGNRRRFSASDAIAIPGLTDFVSPESVGSSLAVSGPGGGSITMASNGTVKINDHLEVLT